MVSLACWIVWLALLLFIALLVSRSNLLSPQIGFLATFFAQAAYAVFFVEYWSLDFSLVTMLTLFCGSGTFLIVSIFVQEVLIRYKFSFSSHMYGTNHSDEREKGRQISNMANHIPVERWLLVLFFFFQLLVLSWFVDFLLSLGGEDLSECIYIFRIKSRTQTVTEIGVPLILNWLRNFCVRANYIWSYILVYGIVHKSRRNFPLLLFNYVLGLICGAATGGREILIYSIIAALVQAYFIYGIQHRWQFRIHFKTIARILLVLAALIITFQGIGELMGRDSSQGIAEYLGVYLSAELKNLDIFIREGDLRADIADCYTMSSTISLLGRVLGLPSWIHTYNNPFRTVNGHSTGNVATTFYAPVHDGGLPAVIFFMALMAIVCQIVFYCAKRQRADRKIRMDIIIYSYLYNQIAFSFFSNKFYEQFFCPEFLKTLFEWYVMIFVIQNVRLGQDKVFLPKMGHGKPKAVQN